MTRLQKCDRGLKQRIGSGYKSLEEYDPTTEM